MKKLFVVLAILFIGILLAGCTSQPPAPVVTPTPTPVPTTAPRSSGAVMPSLPTIHNSRYSERHSGQRNLRQRSITDPFTILAPTDTCIRAITQWYPCISA